MSDSGRHVVDDNDVDEWQVEVVDDVDKDKTTEWMRKFVDRTQVDECG